MSALLRQVAAQAAALRQGQASAPDLELAELSDPAARSIMETLREMQHSMHAAEVQHYEHARALVRSIRHSLDVLEQIPDLVLLTNLDGTITFANQALPGASKSDVIGRKLWDLALPNARAATRDAAAAVVETSESRPVVAAWRIGDETRFFESRIGPILEEDGSPVALVAVCRDVTIQREQARRVEQAVKMEGIGNLAAGVAHEINTPLQYVGDNARFLESAFAVLVGAARAAVEADVPGLDPDLEFMLREVPLALEQTIEGIGRVTRIVSAVKDFSHPSRGRSELADLDHIIETAIALSRNEWKYCAEMVTNFDTGLSGVPCVHDEINQVVLNLIVNAAHAIEECSEHADVEMGRIEISTARDGRWAVVRVSDTGAGVPAEVAEKIWDPFFTTKEVGKGTGQGLALAYRIVSDHHGRIELEPSEAGRGATFVIRLPLAEEGS